MAGDWIKMRGNLWDDPRVSRLCDLTGSNEATVIGGLYWLWASADQHSTDGVMPGLTLAGIDRKTRIKGFGKALTDPKVCWLEMRSDDVAIPRFQEHNGQSAKDRAEGQKRKANWRKRDLSTRTNVPQTTGHASQEQQDESVTGSGQSWDKSEAREEKRREVLASTPRLQETPTPELKPLALAEAKLDPETPAAILASVCVANSIRATAFHPLVIEWARDGITTDQLKAAIAKARLSKGEASFPVAYLDPILRDDSKPIDQAWRTDDAKAEALAKELGIRGAKAGEDRASFHQRLQEAIANRARKAVA